MYFHHQVADRRCFGGEVWCTAGCVQDGINLGLMNGHKIRVTEEVCATPDVRASEMVCDR